MPGTPQRSHEPGSFANHLRSPPSTQSGSYNTRHVTQMRSNGGDLMSDEGGESPVSQMSDVQVNSPFSVLLEAGESIAARDANQSP